MIVGNDISNFQGQIDWPTYIRNSNFVICKSSEGTGYIDTWFGYNRSQSRFFNLLRGWYHFARPDTGNSPQQEADFFCNLMNGEPLQEGEIVVLDYEVNYSDPVTWCKAWLDAVSSKLGVKPLIYLNQSTATSYDWQPVVDAGYGLWIAAYTFDPNNNTFETGKWPFAAIQQWTDKQTVPGIQGEIDGDVFFGDAGSFVKYGYHKEVAQPAPEPQVTPTEVQVPVTTNAGTTNVPVTIPSTPVPEVPSESQTPIIPPVEAKPRPLTLPKKDSMRLPDLIVWTLKSIKNTLIMLWNGVHTITKKTK